MQSVTTVTALRAALKPWRQSGESIAFVPTMGNLHDGHIELVKTARHHADRVVVSLFVNPTQFAPGGDFDDYPRTLEEDRSKLREAQADLLFHPTVDEMYPADANTVVQVFSLNTILCGADRPGHFDGVATLVSKLFNSVQPHCALFGEKDFQQLAVIRRFVCDLNFPITIIGVPTVREPSGLAMSSRNGYLTADQKVTAALLYQTLCDAREAVIKNQTAGTLIEQQAMQRLIQAGFRPDYFTIRRASDLAIPTEQDRQLVILTAAWLGRARLIDNVAFER